MTWQELHPATTPPAIAGAATTYDTAADRVYTFGGYTADYLDATWSWDGLDWTRLKLSQRPTPRGAAVMAYDPVHDESVMYGGWDGTTHFHETWIFKDEAWKMAQPKDAPESSAGAAMVFDPILQQILLLDGWSDTTWTWDGTNWIALHPATQPPPRLYPGLAYDPGQHVVVMFGGLHVAKALHDTWTWDGKTWAESSGRGPTRRFVPAMVTFGQHVMLFGGTGGRAYPPGTWTFGPHGWKLLAPTGEPPPRAAAQAAWDSKRNRVVLFGGEDVYPHRFNDTWILRRS